MHRCRCLLHALVAGEPLPEDLGQRLREESLTGEYHAQELNVADALGDRHAATGLVERNRYANRRGHQPLKAYLADGTDVAPSEPAYSSGTKHVR